ncbi:MAG: type II toxin-antitoxin system RelE/ParE family toxin [Nanoarchaeota archaeon]|nr:type II toxin-antitoxin system RelE/ParE family toxin [Nanoarchaeota archaeon]MBU1501600.1 type II toxin-antitoxin system RelE/ParE family toxin [Nanoarchaeota archaeon]MBU2459308.1 type II toxin-antitoxin system RelE/ParE family toxin [Nanoarchaeota archaeon]
MRETVFSDEFKKQLGRLKKKDRIMFDRVSKKIKEIIRVPERFKHLRKELKGEKRIHFGPFVLRFSTGDDKIFFITFKHHDSSY